MDNEATIITQYQKLGGKIAIHKDKWHAEHRDIEDKRVRLNLATKEKLVKKIGEIINNHVNGNKQIKEDIKNTNALSALIDRQDYFMEQRDNAKLEKHKKTYTRKMNDCKRLAKYIREHGGYLGTKYLRQWDWQDAHLLVQVINKGTRKASANSRKKCFYEMQECFNKGLVDGYIGGTTNLLTEYRKANPVDEFTSDPNKRKNQLNRLMRVWDIQFMKKYIESIDDPIFKMANRFEAYSALRVSELFALRKSDVVIKSNEPSYVIVRGQLTNTGDWIEENKTSAGHYRTVTIGTGLAKDLQTYMQDVLDNPHYKKDVLIGNDTDDKPVYGGDLLFPQVKDNTLKGYGYNTLNKKFKRYMVGEFAMPENLLVHFFRHWVTTMWARHKIYDVNEACYMLGHNSIKTTQSIYTTIMSNRNYEGIDKDLFLENYYY